MKPRNLLHRTVFALLAFMFLAALGGQVATGQELAIRSGTSTTAASDLRSSELLAAGVEQAMAGRFDEALAKIRIAEKVAPKNQSAHEARRLLEQYVQLRRKSVTERHGQYLDTVHRVKQYRLAQEYLQKLGDDKSVEKLRKKVSGMLDAWSKAGNANSLEFADAESTKKLREQARKSLDKATRLLNEAMAMKVASGSRYGKMLAEMGATALERMEAYKSAWSSLQTEPLKRRRKGVAIIAEAEHPLIEVLGDLEVVTGKSPWRSALSQAVLARDLAEDKEKFATQGWLKSLLADVEARGRKSIADAEWYEALAAYSGLKELAPQEEKYYQKLKEVRRHVRVLAMYGKKPTTQPSTDKSEPIWKEYTRNADADMVMKAVQLLNASYVTAVDFRKLARGGLSSVRTLAETPQAVNSFPGLKDAAKKKRFVDALNKAMRNIEKRDRVDHLDLQLAMNEVLDASERSVEIPVAVLAVEFADGFLNELDRFSSMIWPQGVEDFNKDTRGNFTGVGIRISKELGEPLKVITPLAGSPAYRAGIKAGDLIIAVDGIPTKDIPLRRIIGRIMGRAGTTVKLRIRRQGLPSPIEIPVVRAKISIVTIKGWRRAPGTGEWSFELDADKSIGYLRLTQFTSTTTRDIIETLGELRAAGIKSLVLDLRFNRGGLLRSAIGVGNEFLSSGRIISTRGRQVTNREYDAVGRGKYLSGNLAVLVNEQSASAAEIVCGALKDWKRAIVVGQRSYGKGSVQNVIPIPQHRALLKLTTAYYYLPSGRLLHRRNGAKDWGVDPDVKVFMTPKQLKRWLDIRRKTDLLQDVENGELTRDLRKQFESDLQLRTAVLLLQLKRFQTTKDAA